MTPGPHRLLPDNIKMVVIMRKEPIHSAGLKDT